MLFAGERIDYMPDTALRYSELSGQFLDFSSHYIY